jgi:hypothetical protein
MKYVTLSIVTLLLLSISACSSSSIKTNRTAFYNEGYQVSGTLFVTPANQENKNSLEFANYKKKIEAKLATTGYTIVNEQGAADYIAIVAYNIDAGQTALVSTPRLVPSSYLYEERFPRVPERRLSATDPNIVNASINSIVIYQRELSLDIVEANSFNIASPEQAIKVYESRVKSTGTCEVIASVFDQLLTAMFNNFPGENGKAVIAKIPFDDKC